MDLKRARELVKGLADGVDPLTGELLPEGSVCNKPEIIRAFYCILHSLPESRERQAPENAGKPWTAEEDALLCKLFDEGAAKKDLCAQFKRTRGAIAARLVYLGKISDRCSI